MKSSMSKNADLKYIPVNLINKNPENPRIFFRQEEMERLLTSIKTKGLLQPIAVYREGGRYIIIDGERRWRTFIKLNLSTIPAIIQEKPSELDNILLMFNIHGLREQWDIYTIAMKIERVIDLLKSKNTLEPTEMELSEETGMTRGQIRRAKQIIALPTRFKEMLRVDLAKPKNEQQFSEDFFLEMENSLRAVKNNFPETIFNLNVIRDVLIKKKLSKIIKSVTDFRKLTKMSTAWKNTGFPKNETVKNIRLLFEDNKIGINEIYERTVEDLYYDKKITDNANNFLSKIEKLSTTHLNDGNLKSALIRIRNQINKLLN